MDRASYPAGRPIDLKGPAPIELDVLQPGPPGPAQPAGPKPIKGFQALAAALVNSTEGYVTTQGSFHLRAPLMYGSVETALALIDAGLRSRGYSLKPGSHEYLWARAVLTLMAHKGAAPLVGAVNGALGVATALTRLALNLMIDMGGRVLRYAKGEADLPEPGAYLKLAVNRDMRMLTDDIATWTFDAMVFGRTLQTGLSPASVPESMRPGTMRARSGLEPSAASQSSGLAIFSSVLSSHLRVWHRDGHLAGKEPPSLHEILSSAPDRVIARMRACDSAMHARVEARLPLLNQNVSLSMPVLVAATALLGGYMKPYPVVNAVTTALLTTMAFHMFGPAWGDQKFIREMPPVALQAARSDTKDEGYRRRYGAYLDSQRELALETRLPSGGPVSSSALQTFMADACHSMLVSGMMIVYLSQSGEPGLVVGGDEWRQFMDGEDGLGSPPGITLLGIGTGLASVAVTHLLADRPDPASAEVRAAFESKGQLPRPESRETTQFKQLASAFTSDILLVALYAGGALGAPAAIAAAIGSAVIDSIDFNNLGVDPSRLSIRRRFASAMESLEGALSGCARAQPAATGTGAATRTGSATATSSADAPDGPRDIELAHADFPPVAGQDDEADPPVTRIVPSPQKRPPEQGPSTG